jgi:hypothetical protein
VINESFRMPPTASCRVRGIGVALKLLDPFLMGDAKALLFVDHEEPEFRKMHVLRKQPVRADDDVDRAVFQSAQNLGLLGAWDESGQDFDAEWVVVQARGERAVMLLRQHGRWTQDTDLPPAHRDAKRSAKGDFGLSETHVSTDQTIRRLWFFEVCHDVVDRLFLIAGLLERECRLELRVRGSRSFDRFAARSRPFRVELQELLGHLLHRLADAPLLRRKGRPAESIELGLMSLAAFEFLDDPEPCHREEQLVATGVLDDHDLDGLSRSPVKPVERGEAQRLVPEAEILAHPMVGVDDEITWAELPQVFEKALLLTARLAFDATLTYARPEDLLFGDVGDAFAPQHESVPELAQAHAVQDGCRHPVAPKQVDQAVGLVLGSADQRDPHALLGPLLELIGERLQASVPVCLMRTKLGDERLLVGSVDAKERVPGRCERGDERALVFAGGAVNGQTMRYDRCVRLQAVRELVLAHVVCWQLEGGPVPTCGVLVGRVVLLVAERLGDGHRVRQH